MSRLPRPPVTLPPVSERRAAKRRAALEKRARVAIVPSKAGRLNIPVDLPIQQLEAMLKNQKREVERIRDGRGGRKELSEALKQLSRLTAEYKERLYAEN